MEPASRIKEQCLNWLMEISNKNRAECSCFLRDAILPEHSTLSSSLKDRISSLPPHNESISGLVKIIKQCILANSVSGCQETVTQQLLQYSLHLNTDIAVKLYKNLAKAMKAMGWTPLHYACHNGDVLAVEKMLQTSIDTSTPDLDGRTPLHLAAKNGHRHIVELLLNKDPINQSPPTRTDLLNACIQGHIDSLDCYLQITRHFDRTPAPVNSPFVSLTRINNYTLVHTALEQGQFAAADFLIRNHFNRNGRGVEYRGPLCTLAKTIDLTQFDNINESLSSWLPKGMSLIQAAIQWNITPLLKHLLIPPPNCTDLIDHYSGLLKGNSRVCLFEICKANGKTALDTLFQILIECTGSYHKTYKIADRTPGGLSALKASSFDLFEWILQDPAAFYFSSGYVGFHETLRSLNRATPNDYTRLLQATVARVLNGFPVAVETLDVMICGLMEKGGDPAACMPLFHMSINGGSNLSTLRYDILVFIHNKRRYSYNINTQDADGRTILHHMVEARDERSVKYLVDRGARVDIRDHNGMTPLRLSLRLYQQCHLYNILAGGKGARTEPLFFHYFKGPAVPEKEFALAFAIESDIDKVEYTTALQGLLKEQDLDQTRNSIDQQISSMGSTVDTKYREGLDNRKMYELPHSKGGFPPDWNAMFITEEHALTFLNAESIGSSPSTIHLLSDGRGNTLLHAACMLGYAKFAVKLIEKYPAFDIYRRNEDAHTPLTLLFTHHPHKAKPFVIKMHSMDMSLDACDPNDTPLLALLIRSYSQLPEDQRGLLLQEYMETFRKMIKLGASPDSFFIALFSVKFSRILPFFTFLQKRGLLPQWRHVWKAYELRSSWDFNYASVRRLLRSGFLKQDDDCIYLQKFRDAIRKGHLLCSPMLPLAQELNVAHPYFADDDYPATASTQMSRIKEKWGAFFNPENPGSDSPSFTLEENSDGILTIRRSSAPRSKTKKWNLSSCPCGPTMAGLRSNTEISMCMINIDLHRGRYHSYALRLEYLHYLDQAYIPAKFAALTRFACSPITPEDEHYQNLGIFFSKGYLRFTYPFSPEPTYVKSADPLEWKELIDKHFELWECVFEEYQKFYSTNVSPSYILLQKEVVLRIGKQDEALTKMICYSKEESRAIYILGRCRNNISLVQSCTLDEISYNINLSVCGIVFLTPTIDLNQLSEQWSKIEQAEPFIHQLIDFEARTGCKITLTQISLTSLTCSLEIRFGQFNTLPIELNNISLLRLHRILDHYDSWNRSIEEHLILVSPEGKQLTEALRADYEIPELLHVPYEDLLKAFDRFMPVDMRIHRQHIEKVVNVCLEKIDLVGSHIPSIKQGALRYIRNVIAALPSMHQEERLTVFLEISRISHFCFPEYHKGLKDIYHRFIAKQETSPLQGTAKQLASAALDVAKRKIFYQLLKQAFPRGDSPDTHVTKYLANSIFDKPDPINLPQDLMLHVEANDPYNQPEADLLGIPAAIKQNFNTLLLRHAIPLFIQHIEKISISKDPIDQAALVDLQHVMQEIVFSELPVEDRTAFNESIQLLQQDLTQKLEEITSLEEQYEKTKAMHGSKLEILRDEKLALQVLRGKKGKKKPLLSPEELERVHQSIQRQEDELAELFALEMEIEKLSKACAVLVHQIEDKSNKTKAAALAERGWIIDDFDMQEEVEQLYGTTLPPHSLPTVSLTMEAAIAVFNHFGLLTTVSEFLERDIPSE